MSYLYSPATNSFYAESLLNEYRDAGTLPDDAIQVDESVWCQYAGKPPEGKIRGVIDGLPAWVDVPPPTKEELIAAAEAEKAVRINRANDCINGRQWPGKAALGRLKETEKAQYNAWLDYLDALEAVDTSSAPDKWPRLPEEQAS